LGNPAPLGLGAFALTTFVLSVFNAGILIDHELSDVVLPVALFYGGITQFVAGLYSFRVPNTFAATVFCSYGAFWASYAAFIWLIVPRLPSAQVHQASALFLFAWTIFTLYVFIASIRVELILALILGAVLASLSILTIAAGINSTALRKVGGYFGLVAAVLAWYNSAAVLINTSWDRVWLPTGIYPLWNNPFNVPRTDLRVHSPHPASCGSLV